jgi:hypothetical protein
VTTSKPIVANQTRDNLECQLELLDGYAWAVWAIGPSSVVASIRHKAHYRLEALSLQSLKFGRQHDRHARIDQ